MASQNLNASAQPCLSTTPNASSSVRTRVREWSLLRGLLHDRLGLCLGLGLALGHGLGFGLGLALRLGLGCGLWLAHLLVLIVIRVFLGCGRLLHRRLLADVLLVVGDLPLLHHLRSKVLPVAVFVLDAVQPVSRDLADLDLLHDAVEHLAIYGAPDPRAVEGVLRLLRRGQVLQLLLQLLVARLGAERRHRRHGARASRSTGAGALGSPRPEPKWLP
mmetsp:Transcript_74231/g.197043  ORF Transcript_74231/g.197043 Transcript_74231/m.197043 type:complete len:218 (+) Transcript_74231:99-752(+)